MKTELTDRVLWHDGTNEVHPDKIPNLLFHGTPLEKIIATQLNRDVELFNQLADSPIQCEKTQNSTSDFSWNIPAGYQNIDLADFFVSKLRDNNLLVSKYIDRLSEEFAEAEKYNLAPLLRTLIFVIDVLKAQRKVWGVGRGSSCASLMLHLIGVHEVDPVKFGIPLTEFFHDD